MLREQDFPDVDEGLQPELQDVWRVLVEPPGPAIASPADDDAAVLSTPDAWSLAVFGAGRSLRSVDGALARAFADPTTYAECLSFLEAARDGEARFGLIDLRGEGLVAVCCVRAAIAARWVPNRQAELGASGAETALVAFAPSRSVDLVRRATEAFGLTPLEGRLVEALMQAPSLAVAAEQIGVGRETAKEALANALRKVGVDRAAQLITRVINLICGVIEPMNRAPAADLPGLTAAETRVAEALGSGETAEAVAASLGVTVHTIKSQRKSIFSKLGINRSRDLSRVLAELRELRSLAGRSQVTPDPTGPDAGRLRVLLTDRERRVALIDYGPASGLPVFVGHGLATGMRLPRGLVAALQARGLRPMVPQRPGFGLTDPETGDYLKTAADDMALILARIGARRATLLMREGGIAAALAFGERHPERLDRGLLLNPRLPLDRPLAAAPTLGDQISRFLMRNPALIAPFFEALRRRTRADLLQAIFQRVYSLEVDRACAAQPAVREHLVRDVQGLVARTSVGVTAEHLAYAQGWRPSPKVDWSRWRMAYSASLWSVADLAAWKDLGLEGDALPGAGLLAQFTHAEALAGLL